MKPIICCIVLLSLFSCHSDTSEISGGYALLKEIKMDNKTIHSYEYENNQLKRELTFSSLCDENTPVQQMAYSYQNGKLSKFSMADNQIFSSFSSICNPALGILSEQIMEYDTQGRIVKVTSANSYALFEYNSQNQVIKQTLYLPNGNTYSTSLFGYDSRGNLIEETDNQGNKTYYEYDNHPNPYYYMNQRPQWISGFNKSPNNIIKATGYHQFERRFKYNAWRLPAEVTETNVTTVYFMY
jgi:YD repeat-containing protein